jgi:hypothetical protein
MLPSSYFNLIAQEHRLLSPDEQDLRSCLKRRAVSLAIIIQARKKQSARIANIKEGDANSKFFHSRVNARRRKNHMHRLKHNGGWVTEHEQKKHIVYEYFSLAMGRGPPTSFDLNWESLNLGNGVVEEMEEINAPITERRCIRKINQMPSDKAP